MIKRIIIAVVLALDGADRLGSRGFAVAAIMSFAVSLLLYLVPHSG